MARLDNLLFSYYVPLYFSLCGHQLGIDPITFGSSLKLLYEIFGLMTPPVEIRIYLVVLSITKLQLKS